MTLPVRRAPHQVWRAFSVRAAVGVLLLAALVLVLDWRQVTANLGMVGLWAVFAAVGLNVVIYLLLAVRWFVLARRVTGQGFAAHVAGYFVALGFNSFTPSNVGGDVYRLVSLGGLTTGRAGLVRALVHERVIGLFAYLLAYLLCLGWLLLAEPAQLDPATAPVFASVGLVVLAILGGGTLVAILTRSALGRLARWEGRVGWAAGKADALLQVESWTDRVLAVILSLIACAVWIVVIEVVALALGVNVSLMTIGLVATMVEVVRVVPLTVQGIGVREAAWAYLFALAGRTREEGFAIGLIAYATITISLALACLPGWLMTLLAGRRTSGRGRA